MRVLFDSIYVTSPGGLMLRNELTRALAGHASPEGDVVLLATDPPPYLYSIEGLTVVEVPRPGRNWISRWLWHRRELPRMARHFRAEAVYSLSGVVSSALRRTVATVTTCNNMLLFDRTHMGYPRPWTPQRLKYYLMRRQIVSAFRTADAGVLHSKHALDLISRDAGNISVKTDVVLTGVPADMANANVGDLAHPYDDRPYFFYLSPLYPYKNHLALIEAYAEGLKSDPTLPDLLLAGVPGDRAYGSAIDDLVAELRLDERVRHLGVLDREDIPAWFHHAEVNLFPSTVETNSVALAEIIGVGGVLACSDLAPMPEIVGNAAALFDPEEVSDMARVLNRLHADPSERDRLRARATERAREISWDSCAAVIWEAIARAVAGRSAGVAAERRSQ